MYLLKILLKKRKYIFYFLFSYITKTVVSYSIIIPLLIIFPHTIWIRFSWSPSSELAHFLSYLDWHLHVMKTTMICDTESWKVLPQHWHVSVKIQKYILNYFWVLKWQCSVSCKKYCFCYPLNIVSSFEVN